MSMSWNLQKYAYYIGKSTTQQNDWKLFESAKDDQANILQLTITSNNQLVVTNGSNIQESHSLWNAQDWMKGVHKEDSILIVYKIQNESRRFRVKFAPNESNSGVSNCGDAVARLSKFFTFKNLSVDENPKLSQASSNDAAFVSPVPFLEGDVPLAQMSKVFTGDNKVNMSVAYKNTNIPTEDLSTLVRLCLTDSNFPAFVESVEKELNKVQKLCES